MQFKKKIFLAAPFTSHNIRIITILQQNYLTYTYKSNFLNFYSILSVKSVLVYNNLYCYGFYKSFYSVEVVHHIIDYLF
jgi:hypothetical protein